MKKLASLLFIVFPCLIFAQTYQLPNGNFESWGSEEPAYWNGFPTSQCDLSGLYALGCSAAQETRHEQSTDVRPGTTGTSSCKLFATVVSLLGSSIPANGTLTTGQIRIGSSTPASPENYNISRTADGDLSQSFTGKPDYIRFWAKFECPSATQEARMNTVIHDAYDYRDPEGSDANAGSHVVAKATRQFTITNGWQEFVVPFDYQGYTATNPAYILITFTTNAVQGEGSANDFLYLDDIEMIYDVTLSDLQLDGATVTGFDANTLTYTMTLPAGTPIPTVSAVATSPRAQVNITQATITDTTATVVVTSGDAAQTYSVVFSFTNAIQENNSNSFSVFPNPATDNITVTMVEGTQATQVVVYNAHGQQVRSANVTGNDVTIDVKDLEAGVYFISLQNGNTVVGTSKMIRK